ncbi:MAG: hypothetical protein VX346_29185 [Planctomycetota bacterium]|nr:hypothetical protein [Planctomycetota bacterium]
MGRSSSLSEHRVQRYGLLAIWGLIGAGSLLIWGFTQAELPLFWAIGALAHAVLFDALLRFVGKEKRSPLDWLVISPFKAIYKALVLLNRYPAGCLPVGVLVFGGLALLDMDGGEWACVFFAVSLFLVWLRVLWNVCTSGPTTLTSDPTSDSDG